MTHRRLGPGIEFDRIRAVTDALGAAAQGLGDDCAIIVPSPMPLAVSVDASVDGVHFRREWLKFEEIGWRATAAALSDLAAMAADPIGCLVALVTPLDLETAQIADLMRGAGEAAGAAGAAILGGDMTRGRELVVSVTVMGRAGRPVWRDGARPGHGVWVTGALGGARAALEAWRAHRTPGTEARWAFARPVPRIAAGRWLADHGATALIDLSDGLAGDAGHIAAASAVRLDIDLDRLPLHSGVAAEAKALGEAPEIFAARGGEDYELLVTLPAAFGEADAARCLADAGVPLTHIGTVVEGSGLRLRLGDAPVTIKGFDHFA